jgi:hypothetical protein
MTTQSFNWYKITPQKESFFFLGKINLISLIVVKSIKVLTNTEHTVLQDHNRNKKIMS